MTFNVLGGLMRPRIAPAVGAMVLALAAGGCGASTGGGQDSKAANPNAPEVSPPGDIPDNQAYVRYAPPGGGYSVKVPEGWARTAGSGAETFTDKLNSIRMEAASASGARSAPAGATSVKVATVKRAAGTATQVSYL